MPLTDRLERAFADRVSDLPDATRLLLLVVALSDDDRLDEILQASMAVTGKAVDLDAAAPAAEAGIVTSGWNANVERLQRRWYPVIAAANPLRDLGSDSAYVSASSTPSTGHKRSWCGSDHR
jgi:hypothetical protein